MKSVEKAKQHLERIKGRKVIVLGDFILDEYIWGETKRISPEAPVPVVRINNREFRLGGAANVANNLKSLTATPIPVSVLGGEPGKIISASFEEKEISTLRCITSGTYENSRKTRVVCNHQQMLRIDADERLTITLVEEALMLDKFAEACLEANAIVISDYKKGTLSERVLTRAIKIAKLYEIPIVVDPKGKDYSGYKGATIITPNETEFEEVTRVNARGDQVAVKIAAFALINKLELEALLLTRGELGMTLFLRDGNIVDIPSEALEVFDVTGAGDTVAAALAYCLSAKIDLETSARIANEAAAVVVGKIGTATCSLDDLHTKTTKLKEREDLAREISQLKSTGKKIVFTNGCFDILHSGHVKLLQKASTLGDVLVVGINSDASVKRLKGEDRPYVNEEDRSNIIASLGCVDYVTIFDEDTPEQAVIAVRPDVLVKGSDYAKDKQIGEIVGQKFVEENGGSVVLVDLKEGYSTTSFVEKIKSRAK